MTLRTLRNALVAMMIFGVVPAFGQNDLSFYPVRTLVEALKDSVDPSGPKADFHIDGRQLKSRSSVIFTGEVRKVKDKRRKFVGLWIETRGLPKEVSKALENEAQFREGDLVLWMPIRQRTLELLRESAKKGARVDVYTILAGAVSVDGEIQPIFIVGGITQ